MFDKIVDWFASIVDAWDTKGIKFTIYATIAILIGGLFELVPPFFLAKTVAPISAIKPLSPLELAGRDVYQSQGCNNCHTQMIRPFKAEVDRFDPTKTYGKDGYSKGGEYVYEHPFLWSSKRTGPDLSHESQIKPSDAWHKRHLLNPRDTSPGSIMPAYRWLFYVSATINAEDIRSHMKGLATVGVPYTDADYASVEAQVKGKTEGDAVIAYLMRLGRDMAEYEKSQKQK
jgi:cytochrome c oxidase cbb3-type subunit 2